MIDGSKPTPPKDREFTGIRQSTATPPIDSESWTTPAKPKETIVPFGGKIVLGGKK